MNFQLDILLINLLTVLALMFLGWLISVKKDNVTLVDSLWGLGFVAIAWMTVWLTPDKGPRQAWMAVLVTLWGLRLSLHLSWRNWGQGEDPRYGQWRKASGERFWIVSLYKVFLLQAIFLWLIALSLQVGQMSPTPPRLTAFDYGGIALWTVGFLFESAADWQLLRFKANPANKGQVMDRGLWAYSRHPNYFGEVLVWWGLFLMTLATPNSAWTIVSPLIITTVLLKMTGIPLTEEAIARTRPGYTDYVRRTNAFIPGWPRKEGP
jgi:steroid 5-alpha reductase family enzyme